MSEKPEWAIDLSPPSIPRIQALMTTHISTGEPAAPEAACFHKSDDIYPNAISEGAGEHRGAATMAVVLLSIILASIWASALALWGG
jgi:hypothetical protein